MHLNKYFAPTGWPDTEPGRLAEEVAVSSSRQPSHVLSAILPAATPVVITKKWLQEIAAMQNSFRAQWRNVVAVHSFLQKRHAMASPGLYVSVAAIQAPTSQAYTFKLPGSAEAFTLFVATLSRKSGWLNSQAQIMPGANTLKLPVPVRELATMELELHILLEALTAADYAATVLQWQAGQRQVGKMAG